MPIPTIVQEIGKSLEERKKAKQTIDESVNLGNLKDKKCTFALSNAYFENAPTRLLDEGAIMYEGGEEVRLFIMKGAIEKFYNSLSDDYVGYINLAHTDIWSLPLNLGTWTKQDLSLVDLANDRKGLNVVTHLNDELNIVQDLKAQEIPLSVSVEMQCELDWEKSMALGFPCVSEIDIKGFSIVGNPANVNSSDVSLQVEGEEKMNFMDLLKGKETAPEVKEELETEESKEEVLETEVEEEKEEPVTLSEEQATMLEKFMEEYNSMKEQVEVLSTQIEELKAENEDLKANKMAEEEQKLQTRTDMVLDQLEKLMNGSVRKEETTKSYLGSLESEGDK